MKGGKALCRAAMLTRAVWQVGGLSLGLRQRKASGGQKRPGSRAEAGQQDLIYTLLTKHTARV